MKIAYSYKNVPTIKRFSESDKFMRGLMGPFGSGKSSGCVIEIIKRAAAQKKGPDGIRRSRWAVIRNTYPQLRDTTMKTVQDWLPPHLFGDWNKSEHTYLIKAIPECEIEVIFRALDRPDQVSNLLSLELTGAWVNEAREVPWAIIKALRGRVGRFPSKRDGGCSWYGVFMDTNPPDNDSWWYNLFEENPADNTAIFKQPGGFSENAENLDNLPDDYYDNLCEGADEEFIKVYVHGEYGFVQEGKPVYPEYADGLHVSDKIKFDPGLPIYRGWDFGLTPACVFTQLTPEGHWNILDELIAEDMGADRFADEVNDYSARLYPDYEFVDYGDPAGKGRSQTTEDTCFQILKSKGIGIQEGVQDLRLRVESVKKALSSIVSGRPCLQVHPDCKVLRKGFQGGYHLRRLQTSQERYTERPDKNEYSHVHDALQYVATKLFAKVLRRGEEIASGTLRKKVDYRSLYGGRSQISGI